MLDERVVKKECVVCCKRGRRKKEKGRKKEIRGITSVLAIFFSVSSRIRV